MIINPSIHSTKALESLWSNLNKKQKIELLKARGLSFSWAETKSIPEMVKRGGGMIASNLLELIRLHAKRNPSMLYDS